jgi:hypothetical protein
VAARAGPALAATFSVTVVVLPLGVMPATVSHGAKEVAVTGQPAGVVTAMAGDPPVFGWFDRSSGDTEYVHEDGSA